MIVMNLLPNEKPLNEKHICFFVKKDTKTIGLYEVVLRFYRHPQAPDYSLVQQYEIQHVRSFDLNSPELYSHLSQMEYAEGTIGLLERVERNEDERRTTHQT